jgi:hypothetical protein
MFQFDQETRSIRDSRSGEILVTTGHYQDPLRHCRVTDRDGAPVFLCSYRFEFVDVDGSGKGVSEYIFVSGAKLATNGLPDRREAACAPYFQRIGDYFVRSSLTKVNVRRAAWRAVCS